MTFRAIDLKYLVDDHGKDCSLIAKSLGTYDPTTGGLSGGSSTTSTVRVYFSNYNLEDIDGSQVLLGDRMALMTPQDTSGVSISPEVGDEISGEGDKVSIVAVQKIMSATTTRIP